MHSMPRGTVYSPVSAIVRKAMDPTALTVQSILTYPGEDLAGDIVHPDGGTWSGRPYINFNHGDRDAENGEPHIGYGKVTKAFDADAGELPLGTSYFDQSDPTAIQVYRLVEADALTGVSVEFVPIQKRDRGFKSALENRPAREFTEWKGLGWAHCWFPINPNARTVLPEYVEKAIRIAEVGRIGSEPLTDVVRKSLHPFTQLPRPKTVTVPRTVRKAMADEMIADETVTDSGAIAGPAEVQAADAMAADEDTTPPTAKAAYTIAQMAADMAAQARNDMKRGEHTKGKKKLKKVIDQFEKLAEEASAIADMVVADVSDDEGDMDDGDDESIGDEDAVEETDTETETEEVDDDGEAEEVTDETEDEEEDAEEKGLRIVPLKKGSDGLIVTKSGFKPPRRFKLSDLSPTPVKKATPEMSPRRRELLKRLAEAEKRNARRRA